MRRRTVTLEQRGDAAAMAPALPGYFERIGLAGMLFLDPFRLVTEKDTETLRSSETPFAGEPEGRGLEYGPGNSPLSEADRRSANEIAGPWGVRGSANDADHGGTPYGVFSEARTLDHEKAHDLMLGVLAAAAPGAMKEAKAERGLGG